MSRPTRQRARAGLGVGVIGVGRIGAFHARTLGGLEGVSSVSVSDADFARAERLAAQLGASTRVAESPESLFDGGVDAVVIATSAPAHAPLLKLAATAGVPAFF